MLNTEIRGALIKRWFKEGEKFHLAHYVDLRSNMPKEEDCKVQCNKLMFGINEDGVNFVKFKFSNMGKDLYENAVYFERGTLFYLHSFDYDYYNIALHVDEDGVVEVFYKP